MPIIRTLPPGELNKYRDHLLRLSPEDRRLRFSIGLDDPGIESFVGSLQPSQNHIFVVEDETARVVGAVQIAVRKSADAELGISVDAEHRRRGLAHDLVKRAILWARNRGLRSVYLSFLDENKPIRKLTREAGMRINLIHGEAEAGLTLPPPSPLSLVREMTYDVAALRQAEFRRMAGRTAVASAGCGVRAPPDRPCHSRQSCSSPAA